MYVTSCFFLKIKESLFLIVSLFFGHTVWHGRASLVAQTVKNPSAMWETHVRSLGWEDSLEESMATPSIILAWRIPMDRGAWRATVHGVAKSN